MPIHLYQSKKAKRYIGDNSYMDMPWAIDQVDPLTLWYADVFFIKRERYLVFTNPLTKFSFFIFRYSKKNHPDFTDAFKSCLSTAMKAVNIDPTKYLQQFYVLVPYEKSDKSASAHLSWLKAEYKYMIEIRHHQVYPPQDEHFYNQLVANEFVTYQGKDYDYPKNRFLNELLLRRWV